MNEYTLIELLDEIGVDNIHFQVLQNSLRGTQRALPKKAGPGSSLTFATPVSLDDAVVRRTRMAFVVWVDTDQVEAARARLKGKAKKKRVRRRNKTNEEDDNG